MTLKDVQKILKDYEDGKIDRKGMIDFVYNLEREYLVDSKIEKSKRVAIMRALLLFNKYIDDKGASPKMLLENLALVL